MTRRAMLQAALSYVEAGWPIVPGATPYGLTRRRALVHCAGRPVPIACSCGREDCWSPAAHPRDPDWAHRVLHDSAEVVQEWGRQTAMVPNIVLVCGSVFDAWSVPREVGARALDLLADDIAPFVPIAVTPTGQWHLFTSPATPNQIVKLPHDLDVVHLGPGQYVPAPPSTRGALGHDIWLAEQRRRSLPHSPPIIAALTQAAEQLQRRQTARRRAAPR